MSLITIRLREAWHWGGLSARELALRTYKAMDKHETLDRAAIVAYYAMLALVPFLGLVLTIAIGAAGRVVAQEIVPLSQQLLPTGADTIIEDQIQKIETGPKAGLLSVSFVILLWSASSAFVSVMDSTNAAYGVRDSRPWWKRRVMAAVLTIVVSALLVGASISIAAWPWLLGKLGLGGVAAAAATGVQWVVVILALLATFAIAYYFGPNVEVKWEWITPGSALGVLVLIGASLAFRLYLHYGTDYGATYGALAGVMIMLLWLYLASLALLVGAEINCVIEHAAPHGKAPGQKISPDTQASTRATVP
jgi:membrane protein